MGTTTELASWIVRLSMEELPVRVIELAKRSFLDTTGVILAGSRERAASIAAQVVAASCGTGSIAQLGTSFRTSASGAALVNGVAAHALDYDDVNVSCHGHPSAVLVPAVFAAGEAVEANGRAAIEAYVAGFEVITKLGRAMGFAHYRAGWHATATLGTVGAAAAAGKLFGLDAAQMAAALAIAVSMASGSRRNFGTMTKPFHVGHSARCGVEAALLALAGMTADPTAIEANYGFFALFGQGEAHADFVVPQLGCPYDLLEPGLSVKRYPCCYNTHRAADAACRMAPLDQNDVAVVRVSTPVGGTLPLIHAQPMTGLEGKFSMQYVVAAALLDGQIGLQTFTDESVLRTSAQALLRKVAVVEDPAIPVTDKPSEEGYVEVRITLQDGSTRAEQVSFPSGHPRAPLTQEHLEAKYRGCAAHVLDPLSLDKSLVMLHRLEELPELKELIQTLTSTQSSVGR